ncbi:MAG: prepilin peptidase [Zavarzinia sp.]|nr:prepilin peptidase [Zavarzinia sp.]
MADICTPIGDIVMTVRGLAATLPPGGGFFLAALWGLLVGSFTTVAVDRWPAIIEGRLPANALFLPGSRCSTCARPLTWPQSLPLIGWLMLRGRCACGQARISPRWPAMELGGLVVMVGALAVMPAGTPADRVLLLMLFGGFLYVAALVDGFSAYLPDALTLGALWLGLVAAAMAPCGLDVIGAEAAILGACLGWSVMAGVASMGRALAGREVLAAGDWKLMAAIGAWGGAETVVSVALAGSLLAIVMAPLFDRFAMGEGDEKRGIPLGPGFSIVGLVTVVTDVSLIGSLF